MAPREARRRGRAASGAALDADDNVDTEVSPKMPEKFEWSYTDEPHATRRRLVQAKCVAALRAPAEPPPRSHAGDALAMPKMRVVRHAGAALSGARGGGALGGGRDVAAPDSVTCHSAARAAGSGEAVAHDRSHHHVNATHAGTRR